jgi:prophage regulatory protein
MSKRIIRLREVKARVGKGHSSIYEDMNNGAFPKSVPLGKRAVGWIEEEIDQWIESRIAARDQAAA